MRVYNMLRSACTGTVMGRMTGENENGSDGYGFIFKSSVRVQEGYRLIFQIHSTENIWAHLGCKIRIDGRTIF